MSYYDKYIKYKQKYISLKNQNGGMLRQFVVSDGKPAVEYTNSDLKIGNDTFKICGKIEILDNSKNIYEFNYNCSEITDIQVPYINQNIYQFDENNTKKELYKNIKNNIDNLLTMNFNNIKKQDQRSPFINYYMKLIYLPSLSSPELEFKAPQFEIDKTNKTLKWIFDLKNNQKLNINFHTITDTSYEGSKLITINRKEGEDNKFIEYINEPLNRPPRKNKLDNIIITIKYN